LNKIFRKKNSKNNRNLENNDFTTKISQLPSVSACQLNERLIPFLLPHTKAINMYAYNNKEKKPFL
jgi:hypothetical protein